MLKNVEDSLGPTTTLVVGGVENDGFIWASSCLDREMLKIAGIELLDYRF